MSERTHLNQLCSLMILYYVVMTWHMVKYLETWRRTLDDKTIRLSRPKPQLIDFKFGQDNDHEREPVKIIGEELQNVHHFKYFGSSAEETRGMVTEITQSECSSQKLEEIQWSVV